MAEFYTPFNHKNWEGTVAWIKRFGAGGDAAIVATVSGDANIYLYRELARQGISADTIPAMTLSIGESELAAIAGPEIEGHLAAWSYLDEIDAPGEPHLHRRVAQVLRRAECRHRRSDGGDLDRLQPLARGRAT